MEDKKIFLDTNILIYAKLEKSPLHRAVLEKLDHFLEEGFELWISRQVIREYLVWITREESLSRIIGSEMIRKDIAEFQENFKVADDTIAVTEKLLSFFDSNLIIGKPIHDANIVASMKVYNIDYLYTNNYDDFKRFRNLIKIIKIEDDL